MRQSFKSSQTPFVQFNSCLLSAPGEQPSPAVPFSGQALAGSSFPFPFPFPFPAFPLQTTPTEPAGLEQIPVLWMHGGAREKGEILTSPHPGASSTTGNPCWDGLSLWRAQGSPGEQGPGGQAEHPGILSTSPALPAAHAPQERQECRGEDPHSSTAPQNSSFPKFPRAS